ncbi:ANTAR domain-containing response regulator [Salimicrobium album]|uniref:Response regulator receiver and ANTAR domain protein n=1 Tax=Salimicrobium album TaxID=50717 RepID=A0A1H3FSU4_9BACI|nr:response regulator [Salimicrobium album]SDX94031.1 response regulator receiver and ANTAR domain protein [Salimicrobium album]
MSKRILLVEDESIVRMDISFILQDAGFDIVGEAGDGEKAVELAHEQQPDLIIMDIKMPKMDGLKASAIISKQFNIPILLLTAYSQPEYIQRAKEANIVGYLVKPISEDRLLPAVEIALHQGEVSKRYKAEIEEVENRMETRKLVEKAKGLLMEHLHYTEEKSFRKMQEISMNKQVPMEKVARTVIKKYKKNSVSA